MLKIRKSESFRRSAFLGTALLAALLMASGCQGTGTSAEAAEGDQEVERSFWSSLGFARKEQIQTISIPAGTTLYVRLDQRLSSEDNRTGDRFTAVLDRPIVLDDKTVVPSGSRLTGRLADVEDAGRVKGVAKMTLRLESLSFEGREYDLTTKPVTFQAERTRSRDAKVIAGSTAAGAVIGAVAGGRKGAAVGAGVGAGSGTGYVLTTKGDSVDLGVESRLAFSLAHPLEVTVPKKR